MMLVIDVTAEDMEQAHHDAKYSDLGACRTCPIAPAMNRLEGVHEARVEPMLVQWRDEDDYQWQGELPDVAKTWVKTWDMTSEGQRVRFTVVGDMMAECW